MILYDADPRTCDDYPLAKFEGNRLSDKDLTVFQSFSRAKSYARKEIKREIKELEEKLERLERTTHENCPEISNPFY